MLFNNNAIANLIREGKTHQVYSVVETSAKEGMLTLDRSLKSLYKRGVITYDEAAANMRNPKEIKDLEARGGVTALKCTSKPMRGGRLQRLFDNLEALLHQRPLFRQTGAVDVFHAHHGLHHEISHLLGGLMRKAGCRQSPSSHHG